MKYKIKYKALDEEKEFELTWLGFWPYNKNRNMWEDKFNRLKDIVTDFVKEHYKFESNNYSNLILDDQGSPTIMVSYEHEGETQRIWVSWDMKDPNKITAYKTHKINSFRPFYPEELKLLDNLGIPLYEKFTEETGQEVEDWF